MKQDPENSLAYLGKLMAQLRVHNLGELSRVSSPLKEQNLFRRAVEFANDSQKPAILKCLAANTEYLEHIRLEAQ